MAAATCLTCLWEQASDRTIDDSLTNIEWAEEVGVSEASIRRHRRHQDGDATSAPTVGRKTSEQSTSGAKTVEFTRDRPVTLDDARDWIRSSGDDPDDYELSVRSIAYGEGMSSNKMSAIPKRRGAVNAPEWPVIQQAAPVTIEVGDIPAKPCRDGLQLSLKAGDTQVGFRALPDGSYEEFHDWDAMRLFVEVVRREQPDSVVILGDLIDLPSQGKYAQEAGFARTTQMALDATHTWLAMLRAAAPYAHIEILEGNHDKRMQNYVEANALAAFGLTRANMPEEWPVLSLPYLLRLEDLNISYQDSYPAATYWDNDFTRNIHGTRANSKGSTTSQYSQELPHISSWVGHTHRTEITYKTVLGPRGEAIEAYTANPGCLCKTDGTVPSVHGAIGPGGESARIVEDWQQGFGSLLYNETESWPQVHRIKGGTTVYQGVLIGSS